MPIDDDRSGETATVVATAATAAKRFVEHAPCGLLSFNDNGDVLLINAHLLDLLGYESSEVRAKHVDRLFSVAGRIFYQTHFFPLLRLKGRIDEIYFSLCSKSGAEVPMLVSASRHEEEGSFVNTCVLLSMRDRHKLEDDLIASRKLAEDATRAKDEFLAVASHELRTPLTAILGWLHLLKETNNDPEMLPEALEVIERNANLQAQLVSDILDISRIATGKLHLDIQTVDIAKVVRDAIDVVRPAIEAKHITLSVELSEVHEVVTGDPGRLQQICWNVLSNATKFTPKHGRIEVKLFRVNSSVAITVADSGEGIPADFLPYVFDRFRQADQAKTRKHGGLGLGLAIVKDLVELHGGTIVAHSGGAGKGATFEVRLPVRSVHIAQDRPATPTVSSASIKEHDTGVAARLDGIRILLVDDSRDSLQVISKILEQHGANVRTAPDAATALSQLAITDPHILISDVEMPDQDGLSLMRQVRASATRQSSIPAIALTAHASETAQLSTIEAGFQLHLNKPIRPSELIAAIIEVSGQSGIAVT